MAFSLLLAAPNRKVSKPKLARQAVGMWAGLAVLPLSISSDSDVVNLGNQLALSRGKNTELRKAPQSMLLRR